MGFSEESEQRRCPHPFHHVKERLIPTVLDYFEQLMAHLREARKLCRPKDHSELPIDRLGGSSRGAAFSFHSRIMKQRILKKHQSPSKADGSSSPAFTADTLTIMIPIFRALHDDQEVPDKLIDLCLSTIDECPTYPLRFSLLRSLGGGLCDRSIRTGRSEDSVQAVCALKAAFGDSEECIPASDRFVTACLWAHLA